MSLVKPCQWWPTMPAAAFPLRLSSSPLTNFKASYPLATTLTFLSLLQGQGVCHLHFSLSGMRSGEWVLF
jgi:hypothetical protein